ncbi:MAG: hypothetical protein V1799_21515 [bacterium]
MKLTKILLLMVVLNVVAAAQFKKGNLELSFTGGLGSATSSSEREGSSSTNNSSFTLP